MGRVRRGEAELKSRAQAIAKRKLGMNESRRHIDSNCLDEAESHDLGMDSKGAKVDDSGSKGPGI